MDSLPGAQPHFIFSLPDSFLSHISSYLNCKLELNVHTESEACSLTPTVSCKTHSSINLTSICVAFQLAVLLCVVVLRYALAA